MANEYASVAQLLGYLGVSASSNDQLIGSIVTAASRAVDNYCGQQFFPAQTATARQFIAEDYRFVIRTDPFWTTTGLLVKFDYGQDGTYETTLTINTQFIVEPYGGVLDGIDGYPYTRIRLSGNLWIPPAWWSRPQVEVTAQWGWAAVPDPVYIATLQVAAEMWKRKDAPFGVLEGVEFGPLRLSPDAMKSVSSLLRPYRTGSAVAAMA